MLRPDQRQEQEIARRLKAIFNRGHAQPGSGNKDHSPNDVAVTNTMHIECKSTAADSLVVKRSWIDDAVKKAMQFGVPAFLAVRFHSSRSNKDYFIVDDITFYNLIQTQQEHEKLISRLQQLRDKKHET